MNSGSSVDVSVFFSWCASGPGIPPTLDLEEGEAFYDMRNKIVRRLPSWQRSGVVSQQRLRLRRLTLVKRVPKLRFEPVSFLFLAFFSLESLTVGTWLTRVKRLSREHYCDTKPDRCQGGSRLTILFRIS